MRNLMMSVTLVFLSYSLQAQEQTVGLFLNEDRTFEGYTLFSPGATSYLIDNNGYIVHAWECEEATRLSVYLLENGHLVRAGTVDNATLNAGGASGKVYEFDWDGNLIWQFVYSDSLRRSHHDFEILPTGNVLLIAWELKTETEAIDAGRDTTLLAEKSLWPGHIVEVEPAGADSGAIVWEWHAWDHLIQDFDSTRANYGVVAEHPELLDLNHVQDGRADWLHLNAIDYNPSLDQIIICSPTLNEIFIIDHSTTSEEAAGHTGGKYGKGGDLLYRWGNPAGYRAGTVSDKRLFFQHNAQWIKPGLPGEGNILIFNNGRGRPEGEFSSVDEIVPPVDPNGNYILAPGQAYLPQGSVWTYTAENFYSSFISGAQRLPNGNTLICSGAFGEFFEVIYDGEIVWRYVNPVVNGGPVAQGDTIPILAGINNNFVFRANRYAPDYPAFADKDLSSGGFVERPNGVRARNNVPVGFVLEQNFPNPFNPATTISFKLPKSTRVSLEILNLRGRIIATLLNNEFKVAGEHAVTFSAGELGSGTYFYRLRSNTFTIIRKMLLIK